MLSKRLHSNTYLLSLLVIAIGLSTSEFLMSIGSIGLLLNWLLEKEFVSKKQSFLASKPAILICLLFILYCIGMLWTSDVHNGLKELRLRLPIFIIPLVVLTSSPIIEKRKNVLFGAFISTVFISTILSLLIFLGWIETKASIVDVRNISPFISHIRLGTCVCFSFVLLFQYGVNRPKSLTFVIPLLAWFCFFLILLQSVISALVLLFFSIIAAFYLAKNIGNKVVGYACVLASLLIIGGAVNYYFEAKKEYFAIDTNGCNALKSRSALNNKYYHVAGNSQLENHNYIWRNIQYTELENSWNEVSRIKFNGEDTKGQKLSATLIRYLTSKGLCKDSEGVKALSKADINLIESGEASSIPSFFGIKRRLNDYFWEMNAYDNGLNPSGNSMTMRFEFWKGAKHIIYSNWLFGVGTGDAEMELAEAYKQLDSPLKEKYRLHVHNEYLSVFVKLGLIGFVLFLAVLLVPFFYKNGRTFLFISFSLIMLLNFLTENTLETQPGVTFFAFFYGLLLIKSPKE